MKEILGSFYNNINPIVTDTDEKTCWCLRTFNNVNLHRSPVRQIWVIIIFKAPSDHSICC